MQTAALKTSPPPSLYRKQGCNAQKNENSIQPDIFSLLPIFFSFNTKPDPRRISPRNNGMKIRGCSPGDEEQGNRKYPTISIIVGIKKKKRTAVLSVFSVFSI